jgi:hypothetical protein
MASHRDLHVEQSYPVGSHYVCDWVYLQGVCLFILTTAKCRHERLGCDRYPSFELLVWEASLGELYDVGVAVEVGMWEQLLRFVARRCYVLLRTRYLLGVRNICLATPASK